MYNSSPCTRTLIDLKELLFYILCSTSTVCSTAWPLKLRVGLCSRECSDPSPVFYICHDDSPITPYCVTDWLYQIFPLQAFHVATRVNTCKLHKPAGGFASPCIFPQHKSVSHEHKYTAGPSRLKPCQDFLTPHFRAPAPKEHTMLLFNGGNCPASKMSPPESAPAFESLCCREPRIRQLRVSGNLETIEGHQHLSWYFQFLNLSMPRSSCCWKRENLMSARIAWSPIQHPREQQSSQHGRLNCRLL